MEVSVALQLKELLFSVCFGLFIGVVYDVFRILRVAFPSSKATVFIEDFLFFLLASVLTFAFIFNLNNGQIRLFLLFGTLAGAVVYYFTIGALVIRSAKAVIHFLEKLLSAVIRVIFYPIKVIYNLLSPFFKKRAQNFRIFNKNLKKHFIFCLKRYKMYISTWFARKNEEKRKPKRRSLKGDDGYEEKKKSKSAGSDRLVRHSRRSVRQFNDGAHADE